uniref:Uncharacterized protein n=1 Tax=Caenorhabditis japonica TaxID=281687 RepID=A0A8R1IGG4_CAEJA
MGEKEQEKRKKELAEEGRRWLANLDDFFLDDVKKLVTERLENTQHVTAFLNYSSSSGSEDRSDDDDEDEEEDDEEKEKKLTSGKKGSRKEEKNGKNRKNAKKKKKKKVNFTDFYFGAEESNFKNAGGKKEVLHHNEFMGLKSEAFVLRDEEKESKFFCKARKQPAMGRVFSAPPTFQILDTVY